MIDEERAAILEYDAGFSREEAEKLAREWARLVDEAIKRSERAE